MAKGKRKLQGLAASIDPSGYGPITVSRMLEELLLMIRLRIEVSRRAGMSKVRFEMVPMEHAELLVMLLERETRP